MPFFIALLEVLVAAFLSALVASAASGFLTLDWIVRLASSRLSGPSIFLSISFLPSSFSGETLLPAGLSGGRVLDRLILPILLMDSSFIATCETSRALS